MKKQFSVFCLFVFMSLYTNSNISVSSRLIFFFNKYIFLFIYLFLAVLGLRLCARALSSRGEWGHSSSRCTGLSPSWPLVEEDRLQTRRLSSRGSRAQPLHGMWDPPRPGLEPASPAPAGRFSTTAPPGKPQF